MFRKWKRKREVKISIEYMWSQWRLNEIARKRLDLHDDRLMDIEHVLAMLYSEMDDSDIGAPVKRIRARLEARLGEARGVEHE